MIGLWWPLPWPFPVPAWSAVGSVYMAGDGRVTIGPDITIGGGGGTAKSNGMVSSTGDFTTSWVGTGLILTCPPPPQTGNQRQPTPGTSTMTQRRPQVRMTNAPAVRATAAGGSTRTARGTAPGNGGTVTIFT